MSENVEAKFKKDRLRRKVEQAYEAYTRKEPGSEDKLMKVVREFAYVKVLHLEYDFKTHGTHDTADDWAQDVCVKVWKHLEGYVHTRGKYKGLFKKFEGTPAGFYAYVHAASFNRSTDAFRKIKKDETKFVPLLVDGEDEDGETCEIDNPEIYASGSGYGGGGIAIPASVTGTDRNICLLIRDGRKYWQIAEELNMTEEAVTQRLKRLRKRIAAESEQKKEKPPSVLVPTRISAPPPLRITLQNAAIDLLALQSQDVSK